MMQKRLMLHSGEAALAALDVRTRNFSLAPRFEISPGAMIGAISTDERGERTFSGFRWGLTPSFWDNTQHAGHLLFAARAETLAQRPAFAESLKFRRAVVPADGFWMWSRVRPGSSDESRPFLFRAPSGAPLSIAAIWEETEGEKRLALVSVEANRLTDPFGARMPALLKESDAKLWLERGVVDPKALSRVLRTPAARELLVIPTDTSAQGCASLEPSDDARDVLALVYGAEFRADKPKFPAKRRLVVRDHEIGGHVFFSTRSFSRDDATRWHPIVDIECGHVFCDCPDFRYRHERHDPDIWTPHCWCKHLRRAIQNLQRRGELPARPLPNEELATV